MAESSILSGSTNGLKSRTLLVKCNLLYFAQITCYPLQMMKPILSDQYDGNRRWLFPKKCEICENVFYAPKHVVKDKRFCSKTCSGKASSKKQECICAWCMSTVMRTTSRMLTSKNKLYFCKRACKDQAQQLGGLKEIHPDHYGTSSRVSRSTIIKRDGYKCGRCLRTDWFGEPIPLEGHHLDGNPFNNDPANQQLLCRNCHGITPNFGAKNNGDGRKARVLRGEAPSKVDRTIVWPEDPEELRRLVWLKPVVLVAKDVGVTGSAVKRMCNRLGIETPPRGYWNKLNKGKKHAA